MWDIANDPQIYGALEIDATEAKKFLETCKERGKKVTPTHLVGRAVGLLLRDVPELNVRIRGAYAIPRDSIDVFFMTAVEGGKDLTGVKIDRVDEISAVALADALTIDGRVEIRPILPITATIDHRFVDGFHLGRAMKTFRAYLESPATYEADV
jgi:pyruvate/2-oxoglutarate dehydrogenase complex dihydrolipoamide acyltransferase (E2) component